MTDHVAGYWEDDDREEGTLERVEECKGGWSVTSSSGWGCFVSAEYGVAPKVGDRFVTWGSIGRPIRGQAINGRILYYRTPDEQRVEDLKQSEKIKADRVAEYESKRSEYDAKVAALPAPLRERVEAFRAFKPEWRWNYEPYELACCEEAARLAAHFKTVDALKAFSKLGYDEQKAEYPEMDSGHSGNTWGMSIRLAWLLIAKPDLLVQEHGAICALVGCEDCGCYAAREKSAA
jgi:hypothetical protein